jgi:hypothetical protein
MAIQQNSHEAQAIIHHFMSFMGKKREELPWLNGTTHGFPNRVHGFYDCALGFSYISGLRPIQVSCTAVKHLAQANGVWNLDIKKAKPGDAVLFDWETGAWIGKNNNTDHIGMVMSVDTHKNTVTYVSADTGPVIPGIVTVNTVSLKWVAGFARLVEFGVPASVVPDVHPGQREVHSATGAPAVASAPADVQPLHTLAAANAAPAPAAPAVTPSEPAHTAVAPAPVVPAHTESHPVTPGAPSAI